MSRPQDIPQQVVSFRLGDALLAVDVRAVERVLRHDGAALLPNRAIWVEGMLEYQGRVIPVVDLRRRLGLADAPAARSRRVIVLDLGRCGLGHLGAEEGDGEGEPALASPAEAGGEQGAGGEEQGCGEPHTTGEWIGALVDEVLEVIPVPPEAVEAPRGVFRGLAADYVSGIIRRPGALVMLLDLRRLLGSPELLTLAPAEPEPAASGSGADAGETDPRRDV